MKIKYKDLKLYNNPEWEKEDEKEYYDEISNSISDEDKIKISDIYYFCNKNENEIKKILKEILVERNIKINWLDILKKIVEIENEHEYINYNYEINTLDLISFLLNKNEDEKFEKIKNIHSLDLYFENSKFNIKIKGYVKSNIEPEINKYMPAVIDVVSMMNPVASVIPRTLLKSAVSNLNSDLNVKFGYYTITYNDKNEINEIMNNIFEKIKKMAKSLNKEDLNELTDFFDVSIDSDDLKNEEKLENALL